jgi:hypothetical protein
MIFSLWLLTFVRCPQVVPESSAVLGLANERVIPMNAHHRNICRYPHEKSQNYILVEAAIRELTTKNSGVDRRTR